MAKNVLKLIGRFLYQVMLNRTVLGYVDLSTSKMWKIGDKGIVSFHIKVTGRILFTWYLSLFSQKEIDHLFKTLVLPIFTYGLAVYGASDSDLNVIQRFLDRCHKRHFTSQTVSIFNLLEQQDKSAFKRAINNHMLGAIIPKEKELVYNLRRRCHLLQIKTERYKKAFVNRLIFKYNLV